MARKRNQGSKWIGRDKRLAIYLRDGMACMFCGAGVETLSRPLTLDHLLACELGGSNEATNLVTCCLSCNSSKRDLLMADWLVVLRDRGVDTDGLPERISEHTSRSLKTYRTQAKALIARRANATLETP